MAKRTPEQIRQAERKKAWRIRKKIVNAPGEVTEDERTFLAEYEQSVAKPATSDLPPEPEPQETQDEPAPPAQESEPQPEPASIPVPPASPPPLPPPVGRIPPVPPPPRVRFDDAAPRPGGDWRDKYRRGDGNATGRQTTIEFVADQWYGILRLMADQIKMSGADPIIDPDKLYGAIVLTLDEVIPDHVELTPRMLAAGGSTALIVQRFMRRKQVSEAMDKEQARAKMREWQDQMARKNAEPAPEAPPPASTPPAETINGVDAAKVAEAAAVAEAAVPSYAADPDGVI